MRTIIINTLGAEVPQHELLFLPFRDDQLIWLNTNMGGIGACAEKIEDLYKAQDKRQDYRLIVLADLGGYEDIDKPEIKKCYHRLLNAYMNTALFQPLADERKIPPKSVMVVYMITGIVKGSGNIASNREYDYVLNIREDQPIQSIKLVRRLAGDREEYLDITSVFQTLISGSGVGTFCEDQEKQKSNLKHFRNHIDSILETLQKCKFTPSGSLQSEMIPIKAEDFFPKCASPELIWADLQLNLSDFLAKQAKARKDKLVELKLVAHSEEELAYRFKRGLIRVRSLLKDAPDQKYFPLENRSNYDAEGLYNQMWTALLQQKDVLPGVREADDHRHNRAGSARDGLTAKLRKAWIRVDREKKQFQNLCAELDREYDPETAGKQQQTILETCAREFRAWRSSVLRVKLVKPDEDDAKAMAMPELDTGELEAKLEQAQVRCSAMAAEKLEDYEDLRQEAEQIKADFRKTTRIWAPDCGSANTKFFKLYSVVMAVLFLIQMLVPYVGITLGQSGVELSRYVHFLTSAVVFVVLYLVGLLVWMRQLCREIGEHSVGMNDLIRRSSLRRRDSIEAVVRSYGQELPECTILHEDLQELRMLHMLNRDRYARYSTHMELLKHAEELLQELETELQLPEPDMDRIYSREQITKGIQYQKPPSDGANIPYYMLLSDEWGDKAC